MQVTVAKANLVQLVDSAGCRCQMLWTELWERGEWDVTSKVVHQNPVGRETVAVDCGRSCVGFVVGSVQQVDEVWYIGMIV